MISNRTEIKRTLGSVLILVLISIVVYFNSLKGSFQFDDLPLIQSQWVEDLDAFDRKVSFSSFENRPVVLWTYALNNTLGKNQVFGFHLFNLAVHIGVTLLIFFIISRTLYLRSGNYSNDQSISLTNDKSVGINELWISAGFPFATAMLFALHPLNTDSVSYISSRSSLLVTFFFLLTLYLFTHLFSRQNNIPKFNLRWGLLILILISSYLSLSSKLIAATMPAMIGLWYFCIIASKQNPQLIKFFSKPKSVAYLFLIVGALLAGTYMIADSWLYFAKDQGLELYGRMPYFLVQLKVIVFYYLKLFIFPFNLNVDSGLPFTTASSDPLISLAMMVILGILYGALRSGNIWIALGFLWFFITLAPTSSIIPLNDLAVEHRTYLPMTLGLCMVVGWGAFSNYRRSLILLALLPVLALGTVTRNNDWISEISLWKDSAWKNPHSTRSHNNLGKAYFEKGDLTRAVHHLEKSVANIPQFIDSQYNIDNAEKFLNRREKITGKKSGNAVSKPESVSLLTELVEPHYNLASIYLDMGRLDDAEKEYLKAIALRPEHFSARIGLSSVYNKKGLFTQAINSLEQAIADKFSQPDLGLALARLNLGELYGKTGKIDSAIIEWDAALKINPSLLPAHFNLGTAYMMRNELTSAVNSYQKCLRLNDRYEPALFNLALAFQKQGRWEESTRQFKNFLEVTGPNPSALTHIGFNLNRQANWVSAKEFLEKSISLQPNNINSRISIAETLGNLGQTEKLRAHLQKALNLKPNPVQAEIINKMMKAFIRPQH